MSNRSFKPLVPNSLARPSFQIRFQTRLLMLVLIPLLVVTLVLVAYNTQSRIAYNQANLENKYKELLESRQQGLQNVVVTAKSAIDSLYQDVASDDMDAQREAAKVLSSISFGDDNYFFAYQYDGTAVVMPSAPEKRGTNMLNLQTSDGVYLVREMRDIAQAGGGYFSYSWPRPNTDQDELKYTYVAPLEKWNWVIGAGVHATDIDTAMAACAQEMAVDQRRSIIIELGGVNN